MFRKMKNKIKNNKHVKKTTGFVGKRIEWSVSNTIGSNWAYYVLWFFIVNIMAFTVIAFILLGVFGMSFTLGKNISLCVSVIVSIGYLFYLRQQEKEMNKEEGNEN